MENDIKQMLLVCQDTVDIISKKEYDQLYFCKYLEALKTFSLVSLYVAYFKTKYGI